MTSSSYPADYSQSSNGAKQYSVKEMLHFKDGTVGEHRHFTRSCVLPEQYHEAPIISRFGYWVVPASAQHVAGWQGINPSIKNVTFVYEAIR